MKTNRDFYKSIEGLLKERSNKPNPSLEEYLKNLQALGCQFSESKMLNLEAFYSLLRDAFDVTAPASPAAHYNQNSLAEFIGWHTQVSEQIQDLQEMAKAGQLEDDNGYFGINAPSGRRWYNFDPCSYIECGVAGSIDGWEEEDDTNRIYVPGPVTVLESNGEAITCNPQDLDCETVELPGITWELFSEFVWCGQSYE